MHDELPGEDPRNIWRNQEAEPSAISSAMLRKKARKLQARTRLELASNTALVVAVLAISTFGVARAADWWLRAIFGFAMVWSLAGQYFLYRGMKGETLREDATGLEFYRREIGRKGQLFRRVLQWSFGPVVVSIAALIFVLTGMAQRSGLSARAVLPFGTVFVIWIAGIFIQRSRRQRELLRELDELADAERGTSR